jgi:hypothetical protein
MYQVIDGETAVLEHLVSYAFNAFVCFPLVNPEAAKNGESFFIKEDPDPATGIQPLLQTSQVNRPSDIVTLTDAGDDDVGAGSPPEWAQAMNWDFDDAEDNTDGPGGGSGGPEDGPGKLEVHHRTGNNFLFADRHVSYKKVLGENVPRRGVPPFPWNWVPLDGVQAPPEAGP